MPHNFFFDNTILRFFHSNLCCSFCCSLRLNTPPPCSIKSSSASLTRLCCDGVLYKKYQAIPQTTPMHPVVKNKPRHPKCACIKNKIGAKNASPKNCPDVYVAIADAL